MSLFVRLVLTKSSQIQIIWTEFLIPVLAKGIEQPLAGQKVALFFGVSSTHMCISVSKTNYFTKTQHSLQTDWPENTEDCKDLREIISTTESSKATTSNYITVWRQCSAFVAKED